jgi:hypothetical protein
MDDGGDDDNENKNVDENDSFSGYYTSLSKHNRKE